MNTWYNTLPANTPKREEPTPSFIYAKTLKVNTWYNTWPANTPKREEPTPSFNYANEKKSKIGWCEASGRMTLNARWGFFNEKKNNIG